MTDNMQRVTDDLEWFCDKFDYRNKDADWKNSRDAIQRGMQKAGSGYPADPPYKQIYNAKGTGVTACPFSLTVTLY